jgi:hypothetical protein
MKRSLPFTQSAVSRAVKGARAGGLTVRRVEIDREGKIAIVAGEEKAGEQVAAATKNEWDEVLHETS